jgi:hypothetical protein
VLTTKGPLPANGTELETIQSPMTESSDQTHLRTAAVVTRAVVLNRRTVVVHVCIDPGDAAEGSYNGTVALSDERVTAKPMHVVANLQYKGNLLVLGGGFGAALAALAMTYLAASDTGEKLRHWIKQPRTIVGICAALLATVSVYWGSYRSDPNWRVAGDALTYLGIAYAAALAATGTVLGVAAGKDKTVAMATAKADPPQADGPAVVPGEPEQAPEDVKV